MSGWRNLDRSNRSFSLSVLKLLGHLLYTATVFIALFSFAWIFGVVTTHLNRLHPFAPEILRFASKVEIIVLYVDTAFFGLVSVIGMWQFCKEILR